MKSHSPQLVPLEDLECVDAKASPASAQGGVPRYVPMTEGFPKNASSRETTVGNGQAAVIPVASACFAYPEETWGVSVDGYTVMVRNIPNRYTRDEFVEELDATGFQ